MPAWFLELHPVAQAFLATCFTWGMTALGAAAVFVKKDIGRKVLDIMLGFAAGVMIAASYWSLLAPAIEMSDGSKYWWINDTKTTQCINCEERPAEIKEDMCEQCNNPIKSASKYQ